jgi:hypothetical protein
VSGHPRRRLSLSERLYRRFVHKYWSRDLGLALQLEANREAVAYVRERMPDAIMCRDRWDLLELALERAPAEGLLLEFGVAKGDSVRFLGARTPRILHGFDSFEGLPEDWNGTFERRGKFGLGGRLPEVPSNVRLHKGWFSDTVPAFLAAEPGPIAFLHVDCDIYSSTRLVFEQLGPRLGSGAVIVFDEYFNYHGWRQHEWKAFQEWVAARGVAYEYLGFSQRNGHVAVRLR